MSLKPIGAAASTAFLLAAIVASPIGLWSTGTGDKEGKVEIGPCGHGLCGVVVDGVRLRAHPDQRDELNPDPALRGRTIKGLRVLEDFTGGPPRWIGNAYDPKTGQTIRNVQMRLVSPDALDVKGCVAVFCRTQTWTRTR